MKKEVKVIIAVVLAVWFFVMGFELGAYKEKKKFAEANVNVVEPVITTTATTTAPTTTAPTTTQPSQPDTQTTAPSDPGTSTTAKSAETDPLKLSKAEIIGKVNKYVNQVKNEQNMSANMTSTVNVNIVDCSIPGAVSLINGVVSTITDSFGGDEQYTFTNGKAMHEDGYEVTPRDVIPPTYKDFSASEAGVASAEVSKDANGNIVYKIVMIPESTTMASPEPLYNSTVIGYLNLASLDLPINLTKADMHYPGSVITVTVDSQDKVIALSNNLPMSGDGAAKIFGGEGTAAFDGALDEKWTFSY